MTATGTARAAHPLPARVLVAVGGNATHPENIRGTSDEQRVVARRTALALLPLALADNELIISHGNGPVLGKILMRQMLSRDRIPPKALHADGHFPSGSMGPKVEAAIRFLEGGGERAIISGLETAVPALRGETGTHVLADVH